MNRRMKQRTGFKMTPRPCLYCGTEMRWYVHRQMVVCQDCDGTGMPRLEDNSYDSETTCKPCKGEGEIEETWQGAPCPHCRLPYPKIMFTVDPRIWRKMRHDSLREAVHMWRLIKERPGVFSLPEDYWPSFIAALDEAGFTGRERYDKIYMEAYGKVRQIIGARLTLVIERYL